MCDPIKSDIMKFGRYMFMTGKNSHKDYGIDDETIWKVFEGGWYK